MEPHELQQIKDTVRDSIELNVNGKIRAIDKKIDEYIKADIEHNQVTELLARQANEERIRIEQEHKYWRVQVDKTLEEQNTKLQLVNNIQGFGKVFMYIVGLIVIVGTAIITYAKIFSKQ